MILQSHNSWSYLKPIRWWMYLIRFTAKCQSKSIAEQYIFYGVRSFDLRIKPTKNGIRVAHGLVVYDYTENDILRDLEMIDRCGDCSVRMVLEVRNKNEYSIKNISAFCNFCMKAEKLFTHTSYYYGKNLYNYNVDYYYKYEPKELGLYASNSKPAIIDDWWPWIYARLNNRKNLAETEDSYGNGVIVSMDFVNIQ